MRFPIYNIYKNNLCYAYFFTFLHNLFSFVNVNTKPLRPGFLKSLILIFVNWHSTVVNLKLFAQNTKMIIRNIHQKKNLTLGCKNWRPRDRVFSDFFSWQKSSSLARFCIKKSMQSPMICLQNRFYLSNCMGLCRVYANIFII